MQQYAIYLEPGSEVTRISTFPRPQKPASKVVRMREFTHYSIRPYPPGQRNIKSATNEGGG